MSQDLWNVIDVYLPGNIVKPVELVS